MVNIAATVTAIIIFTAINVTVPVILRYDFTYGIPISMKFLIICCPTMMIRS